MVQQSEGPFFSIIVVVYNGEKTIERCMASVLKQSFNNFELIIINDGSTDKTESICRTTALKDKRVKLFAKENGGPLQARIFGAEHSIGKYVLFVDADDCYIDNNCLKKIYIYLQEDTYNLIQFRYEEQYNHLKKMDRHGLSRSLCYDRNQFNNDEYPSLLCNGIPSYLKGCVLNKAYSRSLFDSLQAYNTYEKVFWGDDLILNLQLLKNCKKVLFVPDKLYRYYQNTGMTNRFNLHSMRDLDYIKEWQYKYLGLYDGSIEKKKILRFQCAEIAAWLKLFVKDALANMPEKEVYILIEESLGRASFVRARNFFLENPENWSAVKLLAESDPQKYILEAQKETEVPFKIKLKNMIKRVYKTI